MSVQHVVGTCYHHQGDYQCCHLLARHILKWPSLSHHLSNLENDKKKLSDPNMVILPINGTRHHSQYPLAIAIQDVFLMGISSLKVIIK